MKIENRLVQTTTLDPDIDKHFGCCTNAVLVLLILNEKELQSPDSGLKQLY